MSLGTRSATPGRRSRRRRPSCSIIGWNTLTRAHERCRQWAAFRAPTPGHVVNPHLPGSPSRHRIVRMLRITLAALHLIALGLGLGAVIARGTALREAPSNAALRRAFRSDTTWGFAALLWIATGVWRLVEATEKPTAYYLANP